MSGTLPLLLISKLAGHSTKRHVMVEPDRVDTAWFPWIVSEPTNVL